MSDPGHDDPGPGDRAPHHPAGLGVLALDHVGIAVADLDGAIAFHRDILGMTVVHDEVNPEQQVREVMLAPAGAADRGGPEPAGPQVQLLAALAEDSPVGRFLARRGPGLQQVAYRVADLDRTTAALRGRGVRLLYDQARRGTGGSRINFIPPKDAHGVLIELVEPPGSAPG